MIKIKFADSREMQLTLAAANTELSPTFEFAGATRQAWLIGSHHSGARQPAWEVCSRLTCAACSIPTSTEISINRPTSKTGRQFQEFLQQHYRRLVIRKKERAAHRPGRPKDSAKNNGEGGAK